MTNAPVLVAAGSGVAGSAVIREFVRNKQPVSALVQSRATFAECARRNAVAFRGESVYVGLDENKVRAVLKRIDQAQALRRLHLGLRPLVLPNAWDVASARLVVKAGFPVVATSSGAITAALGYQDNDSMPVDEAFGAVARIARSVPVPVTADVEAGYGLSAVEFVERLLDAGAVGCNLEDTDHHGGTGLLDADANVDRLRAIRQAGHKAGVDIVLNARVDVLRQDGDRRELFEEAVRRARLYLQAGADCVFPIRLSDDALIGEFVERVEGPVNIVAAGAPPLARLAQLGVRRISFAGVLMNQLYGAHEAKLSAIAADVATIDAAGQRLLAREQQS